MKRGGKNCQRKIRCWLDEWKIAGTGIILATKSHKFLIAFGLAFVIFGTLMSLLSSSTAALGIFWNADVAGKLKIIGDGFLSLFGVGRNFWDWLLTFFITILQSILIALVALVWQKKRRSRQSQIVATATNADHLQNVGLAAGLAILGSGCPTCGTSLLAPVIGTLFSTSSYALASAVSGILTVAAIIITLFSLKRIGGDAYALIISEQYQSKHRKEEKT